MYFKDLRVGQKVAVNTLSRYSQYHVYIVHSPHPPPPRISESPLPILLMKEPAATSVGEGGGKMYNIKTGDFINVK